MQKHDNTLLVDEQGNITLVLLGEIFDDVEPETLMKLASSFMEGARVAMMRRIAVTN